MSDADLARVSSATTDAAISDPTRHCVEAAALLTALQVELDDNTTEAGEELEFSAAEQATLELIACTIDRKVQLQALYDAAAEVRDLVKLSAELRLLEAQAARLLKQVRTELPAAPSKRSEKARQAAHTRWNGASG